VLGKFKDEVNEKIIKEFISLRSKLYAFKVFEKGNETKKAEGVKKAVVQKEICLKDFRKCLLTKESVYKKQNIFRTQNHNIYTVKQSKAVLSVHYNKQFISEDSISTLAWGHTITHLKLHTRRFKLCSNEKKAEKLIAKPNFESRTIFT
jgi:hypothetical protein